MSDVTRRQRWRPSVARTLLVLLLVFVFCISAMAAGGVFDETIAPSEASTRILTPEEAQQMTEDAASVSASDERAVPVALIAALLLAAGGLLISLALPTRAERRRADAGATAAVPVSAMQAPHPNAASGALMALPADPLPAPVSRFGAPGAAAVVADHRPAVSVAPLPPPPPAAAGPRRVGARKPSTSDGPVHRMAVAPVR